MATIRYSLQNEIFRPLDERLLTFLHVYNAFKKKKASNFLCLTVTKEAPIIFYIHHVSKNDKNTLKKKKSWNLSSLSVVDGISASTRVNEFDLNFENKATKWVAGNLHELQTFLVILWKHCINSNTGTEFKNIPKDWLNEPNADSVSDFKAVNAPGIETGEDEIIEVEEFQRLSEKEEQDLLKLMDEIGYAANNTEGFIEKLSDQLGQLDAENIQSVLSSEQQVAELMSQLDSAIKEVDKLESKLDSYDDILTHVKTTIETMQQKNVLIQMVNKNNEKLLQQLDKVVKQLEISPKHQSALVNADLANPIGLRDAIIAAKELQSVMNAEIHPALAQLTAIQEQKKRFEKWKSKFSYILSRHLNNLFIHLGNEIGDMRRSGSDLNLPVHSTLHKELSEYTELMHWCRVMDKKAYTALRMVYVNSIGLLYTRDIKHFLQEAKYRVSPGLANGDDARRSAIIGKQGQYGMLGMEKELWSQEIDHKERQRYDNILATVLSQLEPICLTEQHFCITFFQLDILHENNESNDEKSPKRRIEKKVNEEVRNMMGEIFKCIEPELLNFVSYYEKTDYWYCISTLVQLSEHVMSAQDTGSFLSITFGSVLVHVKRSYDKYMQNQIKSIQSTKLPRKSKCGIITFVANFEEFAKMAESIFKNTDRRTDLEKWYVRLLTTMFETIENIASDHPKTPAEVVKMENYHHLYALLSQLKISALDSQRKEAKQKYNEALNSYVIRYFGRPLEKLNIFFEGVQTKVSQGIKESEISYQMAYNKLELRKVIKEYPAREVKKGLDHLYKKVEKHLCEEENLLQVVWRAIQEEFIRQYKSIEDLIQRCYPGSMLALEFSIDDILKFCSEIAQSH